MSTFSRQEARDANARAKVVDEANEKAEGLHRKYHVQRLNDPDGKHADCRYFVLDPQHDPLAVEALEAYSDAAFSAGYIPLSKEIDHWIGRETVPARTPNPEHSGSPFLACKPCDELLPGRGGKPGGIGGCLGAEPAEPLTDEVAESGSEYA